MPKISVMLVTLFLFSTTVMAQVVLPPKDILVDDDDPFPFMKYDPIWNYSTSSPGYFGTGYRYSAIPNSTAEFYFPSLSPNVEGNETLPIYLYQINMSWTASANRPKYLYVVVYYTRQDPVTGKNYSDEVIHRLNQEVPPSAEDRGWTGLLTAPNPYRVIFYLSYSDMFTGQSIVDGNGTPYAIADAVRLCRSEDPMKQPTIADCTNPDNEKPLPQ